MTTTTRSRPLTRGPPPGTTLPETLIALTVAGLLAAVAIRSGARIVDEARARAAAADVRSALALARRAAVLRGERSAVRFDTVSAALAVHLRTDTLLSRPLGRLHGVRLAATRESTAFGGDGLGFGAANVRVVVRRGAAAETVTVSRAGRVR
jgi:Tfp pilus assembly protein FimT